MKKLMLTLTVLSVFFVSCKTDEEPTIVIQGDFPVKEYYLERDPNVNVWGAGMDFVHDECELTETSLDYKYMFLDDQFTYDINFNVVKSYYYDNNGDLQYEGCPAMLLSKTTKACKLGEGVSFFDSLTVITSEMMLELKNDPVIDYEKYKDETTGFYEREQLFTALDSCVIGRDFRSGVLIVPEGKTEQEIQPVYLIKTAEGAYVKFMVKTYKPAKPQEKQTLVRWQVISK